MYDKYIPVILPIVWIAVSTVIALVLYRTSDAFFEHKVRSRQGTKRIRLVGSVVIAAVVFLGLARFTALGRFDEKVADQSRVSTSSLTDQEQAVVSVRQAFEELKGCDAIATLAECKAKLSDLETRLSRLERAQESVTRSKQ